MKKIIFTLLFICGLIASQSSQAMELPEIKKAKAKTSTQPAYLAPINTFLAEHPNEDKLIFELRDKHTDRFHSADGKFFSEGGKQQFEAGKTPARFKFGYVRKIVYFVKDSSLEAGSIQYKVAIPNDHLILNEVVQIFTINALSEGVKYLLLYAALQDAWNLHPTSKAICYSGTDAKIISLLKNAGFVEQQSAADEKYMVCDLKTFIENHAKKVLQTGFDKIKAKTA